MPVRYIRVNPIINLFSPAVRAFGTVAIIGKTQTNNLPTDVPAVNVPVAYTDPAEARRQVPGELGEAIALAFAQSPGPTVVWGVRVADSSPNIGAALDVVAGLDAQLVVLANTPLTAATAAASGALTLLAQHVTAVSETGADGQERIGVAMLPKDSVDLAQLNSGLAIERMVFIAHRSDQDAAVAVAGTIAGYQPHVSLLLKQVNIASGSFTASQIDALNGVETFDSGPLGKGVNWLTSPSLIPGRSVYMGEGYTAASGPGKKKYIDIVRTVDDLSFRLKAQLINTIGNVRISRSGLRALVARLEAVLQPQVDAEVINGFEIVLPLLTLLDRDPATLTPAETDLINKAHAERVVKVLAAVEYGGAVHRLAVQLKFD